MKVTGSAENRRGSNDPIAHGSPRYWCICFKGKSEQTWQTWQGYQAT